MAGQDSRAAVTALPRVVDGAFESLLVGGPIAAAETQPTDQEPRVGQTLQVTLCFQDGDGRLAFLQGLGVASARQVMDLMELGEMDADPCLERGSTGCCCPS